jgi:glycosyltransferase involved in cell wall biosynthesis
MRVLLVSHFFPPDGFAGVERYSKTLADELARAGDTVNVLARRPDAQLHEPYLERERLSQGITVYRLIGGQEGWTNCLVHDLRLEEMFKAVLVETDTEVAHFNHLGFSPHSVELAQRLGVAVVHGVHDFFYCCPLGCLRKQSGERCSGPQGGQECARTCFAHEGQEAGLRWGVRTMYFRRLLAAGDYVICPSRFVADHIEAFGVEAARIRVIPPAVRIVGSGSSAGVPSTADKPSTLTFAFAGAIVPDTGLHLLLDALRGARVADVRLLVRGPLPNVDYATQVREQARRLTGVCTLWHGGAHAASIADWLGDTDCLICPAFVPEVDGRVAREALAAGVPVIVSRVGALPELVNEGVNGFVFSPDKPGVLTDLIQRLATESGLLGRLRAGASNARVITAADHAAAVRAVYRQAIADRQRERPRRGGDRSEIDFLHAAMIELGFARSA